MDGNLAGALFLLIMVIVFAWETFASRPLIPWLMERAQKLLDRRGRHRD